MAASKETGLSIIFSGHKLFYCRPPADLFMATGEGASVYGMAFSKAKDTAASQRIQCPLEDGNGYGFIYLSQIDAG